MLQYLEECLRCVLLQANSRRDKKRREEGSAEVREDPELRVPRRRLKTARDVLFGCPVVAAHPLCAEAEAKSWHNVWRLRYSRGWQSVDR